MLTPNQIRDLFESEAPFTTLPTKTLIAAMQGLCREGNPPGVGPDRLQCMALALHAALLNRMSERAQWVGWVLAAVGLAVTAAQLLKD